MISADIISAGGFNGGSPSTLYVAQAAYASLPAASGYTAGTRAKASDGTGFDVVSNGTRWLPAGGSAIIAACPYTVGIMPAFAANASGTANGATTLSTAIQNGEPLKGFGYVPANTIVAAHAAGFYWFEMQASTTAIKFYNNTYTPAVGVYPTEPTSKTAFAGAVPGSAGATSGALYTAFSYTLPAGILGAFGQLDNEVLYECGITATSSETHIVTGATSLVYCTDPTYSKGGSQVVNVKNISAALQRGGE